MTTRVYEVIPAEGEFEWASLIGMDYDDYLSMFEDGHPLSKNWTPLKFERGHPTNDRKKPLRSDFPWSMGHPLVIREKAVTLLGPILERYAEVLPLEDTKGEAIFAINVLNVIDALDREDSKIVYFLGSNRILDVEKYVFKKALVEGVDLFRLPGRSVGTLVSQNFVDAVRNAGLVGIDFKLLWEG